MDRPEGLLALWVSHLPKSKEDRDHYESSVRNWLNDPITKRFVELLGNKETQLVTWESSQAQYDNANWAYKQAHVNGMRQTFKLIKELLKI